MVSRLSASVGKRRIGANTRRAGYTRDARASMAEVIDNYRQLVGALRVDTSNILVEALKPAYALSQVYVPKDTGALSDSGFLERTGTTTHPQVSIGYGAGGEPEYAAKVHENLEFRHEAPTRAKYLQVALEETLGDAKIYIVSELKGIFR